MKIVSISPQKRRPFCTYRASAIGTMAAVLVFGMLGAPVAGAESFVSSGTGSISSSSAEAIPVPAEGSSNAVDPSQAKITEDQAVAKVRELFPEFKEAQVNGVELRKNRNGGSMEENGDPIWSIQWNFQRGNNSYGFSSEVNAVTGDLLQAGMPYRLFPETAYYPPKVNEAQAKEAAYKFIEKAVPSLKGQKLQEDKSKLGMQRSPLFGPVMYWFAFQSTHEGVKIQGQTMRITVSGNGSIKDFSFYNSSLSYPSSKPKLTPAEAKTKWEQDLKLQLAYVPEDYYGYNREPNSWKLAYVPALPLSVLDAQTGQWLNMENKAADLSKMNTYVKLPAPVQPFNPHPVTADEAIKTVASYADIPEGYTVQSKQLAKGMYGEPDTWQLRWSRDNNGFGPDGRFAQVNAETGQLLSLHVDRWGPPTAPANDAPKPTPLARDKAVKITDEWLLSHIPGADGYRRLEWDLQPADADSGYVNVVYQLFYRDIMVQGRTVNITLDSQGRMVGFYGSSGLGTTGILDELKPQITAEQAKQKILTATQMELNYVRSGGYRISPSGKYVPLTMTLAYMPVDREYGNKFYRFVDAVSGNLTSMYGRADGVDISTEAVDIKSHWAQNALQAAVEHGVLKPDDSGKVHPDKTLTTGDFFRMVSLALNPSNEDQLYYRAATERLFADVDSKSPYYRSVNEWIGQGWLIQDSSKKLMPEAALTRDQLAVYLSRMSGYEKLSVRLGKDASVTQLKDAKSIPHPGAAALTFKLGLMTPKSGKFLPQGKVTVAEAASALLRFAQTQGELDRPLMR